MKICFIISTQFPPQEGIGNHVYNIAKNLLKSGHSITIITRGSYRKLYQEENLDEIKVYKVFFLPFYPFHIHLHGFFVQKLVKKIEKDMDIFHLHIPLVPVIKTQKPIITTFHSSLLKDIEFYEKKNIKIILKKIVTKTIYKALMKKIVDISLKVITVSMQVAEEIKNFFNIQQKKIVIIHNGVDEKIFFPNKKKSLDEKHILYVGRIDYPKGLFDLLECARIIVKFRDDVDFWLVGKGRLQKEIRRRIDKLNLKEKVKLLGYKTHNELPEIYQSSTIFVLPSRYEGNPLVLFEAMACGLPVIVSDAVKGVIDDGKDGFIVEAGNPQRLAERILKLLENTQLMHELGNRAREKIVANYTWVNIAKKIESCYSSVLNENTYNLF